ncbi:glycoside hydrolase family 20 protein [Streptomyces sp. NPDC047108]|uniref:beta-N-acetylhexosaminidase n=1 Tax=Streptomyces sp. NPDC047108 TaxID=3155025 RepID=UPI00340FE158
MIHVARTGGRPRRSAVWAAAVVATAVLGGCSGGDGGERPSDDDRSPSSAPASKEPQGAPSSAPRTIPSVHDFDPGTGPGWKPGDRTRIVADPKGPLADEARMLAGELKAEVAAPPARAGDVELAIRTGQRGGAEGYRLSTGDNRVTITGSADAGVFYGTRTLVQSLRSGGKVPEGVVDDSPDRPQRGFQLDIARKHYTPDWIEARLRQMADLKLNQLGLHFSDDQGFRIESTSHPEVVSKEHITKAELRRILDLAEQLHITVIPEIDSPGHLGAVIAAHPSLQLKSASGTPAQGAVDITNPQAARIVDDLLREYAGVFPGRYMHIGADEYLALMASDPEATYPQLAAAARAKYGSKARVQDLATAWLNDRASFVRGQGKRPKAWNDGFFSGGVVHPDKGIEVEYWTGKESGERQPAEYLSEGRTVVNLNDEYLYYVLGEPNQFTYPTGERIYKEWTPSVLRGNTALSSSATGPGKVPGGRFAVWSDIADAQTQDQVAKGIRLPLAAVAQKLWDPGRPPLSWPDFTALANKLGPVAGFTP